MDRAVIMKHGVDLVKISGYVAAIMTIIGGLTFAGFGFQMPWYARADGEKLQQAVEQTLDSTRTMSKIILEGRKDSLEIELAKAKEEQKTNPDSAAIQRLISRIEKDVADVKEQLDALEPKPQSK